MTMPQRNAPSAPWAAGAGAGGEEHPAMPSIRVTRTDTGLGMSVHLTPETFRSRFLGLRLCVQIVDRYRLERVGRGEAKYGAIEEQLGFEAADDCLGAAEPVLLAGKRQVCDRPA